MKRAVILLGVVLALTVTGCDLSDDDDDHHDQKNEIISFLAKPIDRNTEIWAMNPDGTDKIMIVSDEESEVVQQAVSPNGHTLVYVLHYPVGQMVSLDLSTRVENVLIDNESSDWDPIPSFNPDGSKIVYSMAHSMSELGIRIMSSEGGNIEDLTNSGSDTSPAYNRAGNKIVFDRGWNGNICVINPDKTVEVVKTSEEYDYGQPQFLPDGRIICMRDAVSMDIILMNADGSNEVNLTPDTDDSDEFAPTVNSDGTKIAFATTRNGGEKDVYSANLNGSTLTNLINLTEDVDYDCWRPRFGNIDETYMTPAFN